MSKNKRRTRQGENLAVWVYLGPSIRGVIQNATIYTGSRYEIEHKLSEAIAKYPKISMLIVSAEEVAEVRNKINNGVNSYSLAYESLTE